MAELLNGLGIVAVLFVVAVEAGVRIWNYRPPRPDGWHYPRCYNWPTCGHGTAPDSCLSETPRPLPLITRVQFVRWFWRALRNKWP